MKLCHDHGPDVVPGVMQALAAHVGESGFTFEDGLALAGAEVEDLGARALGTAPPPNGTRFAVLDFPPGNPPIMHRTETLDYVVVLSGEIDMDMDDSTVRLKAGDVLIQRGTNHSWANRSDSIARIAFILIDADASHTGSG